MKKAYLLASLFLLFSLAIAFWSEHNTPQPQSSFPSLLGEEEVCTTCHNDITPISNAHPQEVFGCVRCHGGERLALDATLAHKTLFGGSNPSALDVAEKSCGGAQCHSGETEQQRDHIPRVLKSIQVSYAGAIAQLRFAYGAQKSLAAQQGILAIQDDHIHTTSGKAALTAFTPDEDNLPALFQFAKKCLNCHITAQPIQAESFQRMTGCASCHTPRSPIETQNLTSLPAASLLNNKQNPEQRQFFHKLTTAIPYSQCNTCHNRGNYNMADMQFYPRQDQPQDRLQDYYQPISQFVRCEWTLDCIDCHTRTEVMGDGDIQTHKKDIQYIQCQTCHGTKTTSPREHVIRDENDLALRLSFLNPVINLKVSDVILETSKGEPLWNIRQIEQEKYEMIGKVTQQRYILPLVKGSDCLQKDEEQESRYCHQCHAVQR